MKRGKGTADHDQAPTRAAKATSKGRSPLPGHKGQCPQRRHSWAGLSPAQGHDIEQFYPWAPLVAIEDSAVDDLYVKLIVTFDLKYHMCSNLTIEEVIGAAHIYKNGDGLLSSNFHRLRVGVAGQRVHCIVGRLGLFLRGFIF
ncbi:hypothetical protein BHE74_00046300 [Ensete ventricosum]|nr:hypothetical protein GW17_00036207 [Ensete ventricosum]RWW47682.1 hypothetical protein BHE74_00046300 [Ensete ventricosum]